MGIFGVYVLICTFLLLVYYAVTIWFDFRGNKGKKKDDSEVISAGGIVDTETSTDVKELDGGGYQLSTSSDDEEGYQEKLNCRELVAQMSCPLSQKTRIYRRRSVY